MAETDILDQEAKIETIEIDKDTLMTFIYVPKGYKVSSYKIENANSFPIGYLNNFNRIKKIAKWKTEKCSDLVAVFKITLKNRNWDFVKFPNPYAFVSKLKK